MLLFTVLMYWIFTETKRLLQEVKLALIKSKWKDYYKILGVDENATTAEIKKAYRKRALVHHPG
jgi:preprotein translocase subunit Sec63